MAGPAIIYGLTCPDTGSIRYIGKANNLAKRLASHLRDARTRTTPVYCWITKLVSDGKRPGLVVLEDAQDWVEAERRLIAVSRARGDRLLNVADGGDEPFCSTEVRAANARRTFELRQACPFIYTSHRFFQTVGWALKSAIDAGQEESVSQLSDALVRLRKIDKEELFWRVFKSRRLHQLLPEAIRADAAIYWRLV